MQIRTNKGVGKNALFKGMTWGYLCTFCASIFFGYVCYVVADGSGCGSFISIIIGAVIACVGAGGSFFLSQKFGEKGLTHFMASTSAQKYIHNGKRLGDIVEVRKNR